MEGSDQEPDPVHSSAEKKKRGRPRKNPNYEAPPDLVMNIVDDDVTSIVDEDVDDDADANYVDETAKVEDKHQESEDDSPIPQKKQRGRPRKTPLSARVSYTPSGRKRGRPRKIPNPDTDTENSEFQDGSIAGISVSTSLVKRGRGRPPKPKSDVEQLPSVKRGRGRPRKTPTPQLPGESSAKRGRGRPKLFKRGPGRPTKSPLSQLLHAALAKRKRGRPPKTPLTKLLQAASSKRKPGRPRKNTEANGDSDLDFDAVRATIQSMEMHSKAASGQIAKQRGRPPKHASPGTRAGHGGNYGAGNDGAKTQAQFKRPVEISGPSRAGAYLKSARPSPAILPAQEDLMMEEVVKRFPFMDSVVKVFCIHTEPNFSLPWQMKRQFSSNSSGFVISGRRVLTNAHSVQHHTQVKVKKRGSDMKYLATVLAIGTECDIALLTVTDDEFWEGCPDVTFGGLPTLQDAVTVVGYPIGGDTISVTSGVVSRIEVTAYAHGATELLGVQIDAAINAGNSGGPAFNAKGQCVGIAFQSLKQEDAENIGYIIPTTVISHFINDYERNGNYTGFPILGIEWQKMENPDLRKALGMMPHQKGVLVRRVEPTAPAAKYLQSSDIILSFDDIDVANDGTVPFRDGERIGFSYLVSQKYTGENAKLKILRGTTFLEFNIELETHKRLIPVHIKGLPPSYYIVAGLVFAAVSVPYLRSEYGKDYHYEAPVKLLDKLLHSLALSEDEQLVVISQVLVADINIGYEEIVNTQILSLNGVPVKNLKHLAEMVDTCEEQFLKFDLEYQQVVVLETKRAKEATPEILATHCIPSASSEDLK